jgi:hypothetical protein
MFEDILNARQEKNRMMNQNPDADITRRGLNKEVVKSTFNSNTAIEKGHTGFPVRVHDVVRTFLLIDQSLQ